jgi:hypothetical protein
LVAGQNRRRALLIELSEEHARIIRKRLGNLLR